MTPQELRDLYWKATQNSSKFDEVAQTFKRNQTEEPLYIAYNATIEAMKAQYEWMPFAKLGRLTTAMQLFQKAIQAQPENAEIRLLRFVVQSKIPPFLGFKIDMNEDKKTIIAQLHQFQTPLHPVLKAMLEMMIKSGWCNSNEVTLLQEKIQQN